MFTKVYKHNVYADGLSWMLLTTLIAFFSGEIWAVQGLEYIGCFKDKSKRDLSVSHEKNLRNNTPETCVDSCLANNTLYAGVQNSDECYCRNTYGKYGQYGQDWCKSRCTGDKMKMCGGSWANSIFATGKKLTCNYRVTCTSDNGLPKECQLHGAAYILNVTVPNINCGPGKYITKWNLHNFCGWHGTILWVENGCYVEFNLCYIRLGIPSTTVMTTRPQTSSIAARFTTTSTSNRANTIASNTAPARSSTTVFISYTVSSVHVTSSGSIKQHNLTNISTSPSYTSTNAHLAAADNTTTVAIVVTVGLIGVCLAITVAIIVCRKRHSRKDRDSPLDEETYTSAVYSNTMGLNQSTTYRTENSDRCITNDVYEEANDAIMDDDKRVGEDTSENEYSIVERQEVTQGDKSKYSYSQTPVSEAQDIYSNANDLDETNLDINNFESDTEYNTISKIPQKPIADPDYDRLGIPDQDNGSKDEDYYCHTTDTREATTTLKRLNRSVVDYSHVTFNDGRKETVDSAV